MYLQDIKSLMRTSHVSVRCDAKLSPNCHNEYSTLLHRAEQNKARWGKHVCRACAALAKHDGMLKHPDPPWCSGNQFETIEHACHKCGDVIRGMKSTLKSNWRSYGKLLCASCRPKQKKSGRLFTRRRVKHLAKNAIGAIESHGTGATVGSVEYDPIKAPPPPVRRSKPQRITSADVVLSACRMDIDNQILFWYFLDENSIAFTMRDGQSVTATRHPTNGQMRMEDLAKESMGVLRELVGEAS